MGARKTTHLVDPHPKHPRHFDGRPSPTTYCGARAFADTSYTAPAGLEHVTCAKCRARYAAEQGEAQS